MIAVRPASPADLDGVLAFWQSVDQQSAAEGTDRVDDRPALDRLLARDPQALLLATEGGRLLGTVVVGWDGWRGHLYRLAVDPTSRRQGVARSLLQAAERRLRALGAHRADTMVLVDDALGEAVWQGARFERQDPWRRWVKPLV